MTPKKQSKDLQPIHNYTSGNCAVIELDAEHQTIIDKDLLPGLLKYFWYARKSHKCWYAVTTVGEPQNTCTLSMHRLIARTPSGQICHHRNRNSLDNRRVNLLNMDKIDHQFLHVNNRCLIKFETSSRTHPELRDEPNQEEGIECPDLQDKKKSACELLDKDFTVYEGC